MDNQKLQKIAQDVIDGSDATETDNYSSILIILTVISIILTLVRVVQECDKTKISQFTQSEKYDFFGKNIRDVCRKKTLFSRMTIKKLLKKELDRYEYQLYGVSIMQAIFNKGASLTDDEIKTLVEAANV